LAAVREPADGHTVGSIQQISLKPRLAIGGTT
jgi:hypothetical protein